MKNKSDLLPDTIKVKVGKDGAPLTPPETLTVKIDYSDREFTAQDGAVITSTNHLATKYVMNMNFKI